MKTLLGPRNYSEEEFNITSAEIPTDPSSFDLNLSTWIFIVLSSTIGCLFVVGYCIHWYQVMNLVQRNRENSKQYTRYLPFSDMVTIRALERKTSSFDTIRSTIPDEYMII